MLSIPPRFSLFRLLLKAIFFLLILPVSYFLVALILSLITVNGKGSKAEADEHIFISSNGVHLDIIITKEAMKAALLTGLEYDSTTRYFAFGWGDENFYLNTPTWGDFTFSNAFTAAFLKEPSVIHLTRYRREQMDWIKIPVSTKEGHLLNDYILNNFQYNEENKKQLLSGKGYGHRDDFYKAKGSFSIFFTCNTWVNTALKQANLKACLWTPFDFGVIWKYKNGN